MKTTLLSKDVGKTQLYIQQSSFVQGKVVEKVLMFFILCSLINEVGPAVLN